MSSSMAFTREQRVTIVCRDSARCARCGVDVTYIPHSIHHRRPRGMGGTRNPLSSDYRCGVLVCGTGTTGCHGDIEGNRTQSYDTGWLVHTYDELDTPLVALDGARVHLHADGTRHDEATADSRLLGSLADAVDRALAQRRAALATQERQ